jgi:hypothetical protein
MRIAQRLSFDIRVEKRSFEMERLIKELSGLAVKSAERGDVSGAKQITEIVIMAQRARADRIDRLLSFFERLERLIDQDGGSDQAPTPEPSV